MTFKVIFFCANCLLTNAATCGIIEVGINGPDTAVRARIPDLIPPYAKFLLLLAVFCPQTFFPKTAAWQGIPDRLPPYENFLRLLATGKAH